MPTPRASATQAVILAGGRGTRLRPLTYTRPKPIVPLSNHPFLAYQLAHLRAHGVTDIVLSCGYRTDDIQASLGDGEALGVRLRYVVETQPLGTGGGVRNASDLANGTVFVLNGDVLTDADLSAMRDFHEARGSRTTIFLTPADDPRAYGVVETAEDGRLLRFREKPGPEETLTTNLINAGIYLIDAALLERLPHGRPASIEREFFPGLIADAVPAFGWPSTPYWRDIGSPAAYLAAQIDLLSRRVATTLEPDGERRDGSWIGSGAAIDPAATVTPPSVIGPGASIAAGSRIGPLAILGTGARVGRDAAVERSILWERADVGERATITACIVGADTKIGAAAALTAGVVLESGAVVPGGAHIAPGAEPRA